MWSFPWTWRVTAVLAVGASVGLSAIAAPAVPAGVAGADDGIRTWPLAARVVATGLHRAFGIRQVGRFHGGGPFVSNPEFLLRTQAGQVLGAQRVLVAVDDNFGGKPGNPSHAPGAIVSIDPDVKAGGRPLAVPAVFKPGDAAENGAVQLYSVQSEDRMNRRHNAGARTADFAGVSGPRYLSINNAFGRPWVANAPFGLHGVGSESVLDPDGAPLANAPSDRAGGVFVGDRSARTSRPKAVRTGWLAGLLNHQDSGQLTPGAIDHGAFGTALLGSSPDGSGFAVFAVVTGSGAVVQVHVQDGVDGLAPPGTIAVGGDDPGLVGIAFEWIPDRTLFVADAGRDRIAVLRLGDDGRHFRLERSGSLASRWLNRPVDLAACVPEVANPRFASHTTLAGGSDLYVVNRGDGSLLRMRQDGTVVARASIAWPGGERIDADRLRSLAVSADGQRVWLIAERPGGDSALIEAPGFDANGAFGVPTAAASVAPATETADEGAGFFVTPLTPRTGLGARFNATACVACHPGPGGASAREEHFARRVAFMDPASGRVTVPDDRSARFAPRHSGGSPTAPTEPLPRGANVVSLRMPLALSVAGRLDEIPDAVIEAQAVSKGDGIKGRAHRVVAADGTQRVGRYGWKADVARLDDMVAEALANEMGVAGARAVGTAATAGTDDRPMVRALSAYLRRLTPGRSPAASAAKLGEEAPR